MKLLIVDDQKTVVNGLHSQINWQEIGISAVFAAYSAAEARIALTEHNIDVMLCDIEMPIENGLSLLEWIRDANMHTRCILLTSHADFSYAQKSVSLGAFDYVVQPAPYSDIRAAVQRAVRDILEKRNEHFRSKYGQVTEWQRSNEAALTVRGYLETGEHIREMESYAKQSRLPGDDRPMYLICLQILRYSSIGHWNDELLTIMVDNAVNEVFLPYGQSILIVRMKEDCFALLLWSAEDNLSPENIAHQLSFLYNICRQNLNCTVAIYQRGPVRQSQLREAWTELNESRGKEASRTGVFVSQHDRDSKSYVFNIPEIESWEDKLREEPVLLERQTRTLLDKMDSKGNAYPETLSLIYEDILQVIHRITGNGDVFWRSVLVDSKSYDIYRNAMKSADRLMELVRLAVSRFPEDSATDDLDIVQNVESYIDEHMDQEIHRSDLAEHVFLNPDYLNRLFKKKTGYTLKDFVIRHKMNEACKMLKMTRLPVNIIAARVGYSNFSHFSSTFKKVIGCSPIDARQANTKAGESKS